MRFNTPLNNFSSGEWGPKMIARSDAEQYAKACRLMQNSVTQVSGGSFRRPGTEYVYNADLQDLLDANNGLVRAIPFVSNTGRYILFIGSGKPTEAGEEWVLLSEQTGFTVTMDISTFAPIS